VKVKTRVTELLGSRYPIIQGGMMWVGRAELAGLIGDVPNCAQLIERMSVAPNSREQPRSLRERM
jgi:nitronate monooxygenase